MKTSSVLLSFLVLFSLSSRVESQGLVTTDDDSNLRVILLGTAGGQGFDAQRLGISTRVLAGPEKLLFDCGRGLTTATVTLGINPADVRKAFLTHLHSDHIIALPELYLFPWTRCRFGGQMGPGR